ncbi:hypothetical protein ABK040_010662 [Willaertia magna]
MSTTEQQLIDIISEQQFETEVIERLKQNENITYPHAIVIHFFADWCSPCFEMDKVCIQLSSTFKNVKFYRIDAEQLSSLTERFNIKSVPAFVFLPALNNKNALNFSVLEGANPPELARRTKLLSETTSNSPAGGATDLNSRLKNLINQDKVMIFIKGTPDIPKCGFSSKLVDILRKENVKFSAFDILSDESVRQGLKTYSNWPTYPQLYVNGELIGGLDIVKEMQQEGNLKEQLGLVEEEEEDLNTKLHRLINKAPVMLFMKGTPEVPKCGFSSKMVNILKQEGIEFDSFDILSDESVRQGLKTYSNWPTYPQLYSKGQLVGGLDVVKELQEQGELRENL